MTSRCSSSMSPISPQAPEQRCAPSTRAAYGKLASYGGGLAHSVISLNGGLSVEELSSLPDEEFIAALTAISGISPWTAQGALLMALQGEDVVLPGDQALRKAVQNEYQLDHLPSQQKVVTIAGHMAALPQPG